MTGEADGKRKDDQQDEFKERPWIVLTTSYDVEAWTDQFNRDLQQVVSKPQANRHGICFRLGHGGEIFLHTDPEGEVILDVTPEAEWVTPVIVAATGCNPPSSQIWALPGTKLTQLLLGLSSLIESSRVVIDHDFRIRKRLW
ncbi:hypothetical protein EDC30_105174 [Paucimonas lemoignei]|uniref:Uncharacterized protein n=1 Tax=Paucimonas lemoignei TaxID=29443 RepID=A0A4R3HV10_PAULE|nr:hypothetical protein [Paucimonas lemoignei]TCS36952.1 hypothetical protein EDC30_105174 [Paucimonas lemoignei]